jgi:hypothetical protein
MRFLNFTNELASKVFLENEEVITFNGWIHTIGYVKKNPHSGIPQLILYIRLHNPSKTVKDGFVKACLEYQKAYPNSISKEFQNGNDLLSFVNNVHSPI